jgi:hypothetical protein
VVRTIEHDLDETGNRFDRNDVRKAEKRFAKQNISAGTVCLGASGLGDYLLCPT